MIKTIFRIENPVEKNGMWYDKNGNYKPIIKDLCPNGITKDLPMPFNELHKKDGLRWFSAARSIENMHQWFSADDAIRLFNSGFRLFKFKVTMYQELEMEVLFCREGIVECKEIPLDEVWNELKTSNY